MVCLLLNAPISYKLVHGACVKSILCNMQQQNIRLLLAFANINFKELHLVRYYNFLKEISCPFQAYSGQHQSCYVCRKSLEKGHRKEMYTALVSSYRKSSSEPLHITSMSCRLPKVFAIMFDSKHIIMKKIVKASFCYKYIK